MAEWLPATLVLGELKEGIGVAVKDATFTLLDGRPVRGVDDEQPRCQFPLLST